MLVRNRRPVAHAYVYIIHAYSCMSRSNEVLPSIDALHIIIEQPIVKPSVDRRKAGGGKLVCLLNCLIDYSTDVPIK